MSQDPTPAAVSAWRIPALWLAIAGPVLVVVAGFATLALALRGADTPIRDARETRAAEAQTTTPALQARNHVAATTR